MECIIAKKLSIPKIALIFQYVSLDLGSSDKLVQEEERKVQGLHPEEQ